MCGLSVYMYNLVEIAKKYINGIKNLSDMDASGGRGENIGEEGRKTLPISGSVQKLQNDNLWQSTMQQPKKSSTPHPVPLIRPPIVR